MKITLKLLKKDQHRSKATEIFKDQEFDENQTLSDIFNVAKKNNTKGDIKDYKFQYGSDSKTASSDKELNISKFLGQCGASVMNKDCLNSFVLYLVED